MLPLRGAVLYVFVSYRGAAHGLMPSPGVATGLMLSPGVATGLMLCCPFRAPIDPGRCCLHTHDWLKAIYIISPTATPWEPMAKPWVIMPNGIIALKGQHNQVHK